MTRSQLLPFLERLKRGVVLADGAMGTLLHQRGAPFDACFDALNLTAPEQVQTIHQAYIAAGAEVIETNTFGANRFKLGQHNRAAEVAAINHAGVALARAAVGNEPIYIAGSVGPLGVRLAPYGRVSTEQAFEAFYEQIAALILGGVDLIILETFTDLAEIAEAVRAARAANPSVPVVASVTLTRDSTTIYGDPPREIARALAATGADVIGVNCSSGPSQLARVAQVLRAAQPELPIAVMPNAGYPETVNGRVMYPAAPNYFGDYAVTLRGIGVRLIGGCCGTTPEHIHAMRTALQAPDRVPHITISAAEPSISPTDPSQNAPTRLAQKLAAGKFVTTVEMAPPRSFNAQKVLAAAQMLQEAGVDCIDVSDSPMARMRMSPWAVCHLIQAQLGMETILHFPTRGRNILRVQSDLLGAHALDVRNILVLMGDPTSIGDYPEANDKYDIVPSGLITLIKHKLNSGQDQAGNSIGQPTAFTVGCALNLTPQDVDDEIERLRKKIEAGADFAMTQSVYEPHKVEQFLKRHEELYGPLTLPILVGILPLYGARHAAFLNNEVPGISIPESLMRRISAAGDVAPAVGVQIAAEILRDLHGMVQGAYIIPPFGKYEMAAEIVEALALRA